MPSPIKINRKARRFLRFQRNEIKDRKLKKRYRLLIKHLLKIHPSLADNFEFNRITRSVIDYPHLTSAQVMRALILERYLVLSTMEPFGYAGAITRRLKQLERR